MHFIVIALAIAVLVLLLRALSSYSDAPEYDPERELLLRCLGDRAQVDRLIQGEMSRNPAISRAEAARRAGISLMRDQ